MRIERNLGEGEVAESQDPLGLEAYYAVVAVKSLEKKLGTGLMQTYVGVICVTTNLAKA